MTMFINLLVLLTIVLGERLDNIDYLGFSYNIYEGNPLNTKEGLDPGFTLRKVFNFTYIQNKKTSDGRYDIPDNTDVVKEEACSLAFKSDSVTGSKSYSDSLELHVGGSFEGFGAKFKASYDYKSVHEQTSKFKKLYTISFGECKVYAGTMNSYTPPKLSNDFIEGVRQLPAEYDKEPYIEFINTYGTHFIDKLHMGARFSVVSRLSESGWSNLLNMGIDVEAAASYHGFGITAAAEVRTKKQIEMAEMFSDVKEEYVLSVMGTRPPKNASITDWSRDVIKEPMPIKYSLNVITALLVDRYFKDEKINNLKQIRKNMAQGLKDYCLTLAGKKIIDDCNSPSPDPAPPKASNVCKFCAKSCGKGYMAMGGIIKYFFANN